jgi:hypothetical protein
LVEETIVKEKEKINVRAKWSRKLKRQKEKRKKGKS